MKAFLDTTVIADQLLKGRDLRDAIERALGVFATRTSHVYVLKEFLVGPFRYFIWIHNHLANDHTLSSALQKLSQLSTTPQKYRTATSLQALADAALTKVTAAAIAKRYPPGASLNEIVGNEYRLLLKKAILSAWKRRLSVVDQWLGDELKCFHVSMKLSEKELFDVRGLGCAMHSDCSLRKSLIFDLAKLALLHGVTVAQPPKREIARRAHALHEIIRKPNHGFGNNICRALGDAAVTYFCPPDAILVTTNAADFSPLCAALNIQVVRP